MARPADTHWSAAKYARNARFVADLAAPLLALLNPQPGETILDIGCGDGALTEKIAAAGARTLGIDGSPDMVRAARARGLAADIMDGQAIDLPDKSFDAVFSNAALHWMPNAARVIEGVARILKPGGRFVGEMGGHGNIAAIATALRASLRARGVPPDEMFGWFFPTADQYAALLRAEGFSVQEISLTPRPTTLPTGLGGWLATFAAPFLAPLPPEAHEDVLHEVEALLAPALRTDGGDWIADYVRLSFLATAA